MENEFKIAIKMNDKKEIGYGVFINGEKYICSEFKDLSEEQICDLRLMAESVAQSLYHAGFYKKYGECPVCEVKSVFHKEEAEMICQRCRETGDIPASCNEINCHYYESDRQPDPAEKALEDHIAEQSGENIEPSDEALNKQIDEEIEALNTDEDPCDYCHSEGEIPEDCQGSFCVCHKCHKEGFIVEDCGD